MKVQREKDDSNNKTSKRPKSATRFPRKMPTYVVAFAVQDTFDELTATHQKICNKRSPQSINSTPSSISSKTLTSVSTIQKMFEIEDIPETGIETKIDIEDTDEYQNGDVQIVSLEQSISYLDDNMKDDAQTQPQVLFDSTKVRRKESCKRKKSSNGSVKIKNKNFKTKKYSVAKKIEKYYLKGKNISVTSTQIQRDLCSNSSISQMVSRCRLLDKVLAKENLLEAVDVRPDEHELVNIDNESLPSSPSTTKQPCCSNSSENTLNCKGNSKSKNEDDYINIQTSGSVIQVTPQNLPYKSDVVNVSVAVTYNPPKTANNKETTVVNELKEQFLFKESLTSAETSFGPSGPLTSQEISHENIKPEVEQYMQTITLDDKVVSEQTLVGDENASISEISSDFDNFVIARTSSDFNKPSLDSTFIASKSEILHSENLLQTSMFTDHSLIGNNKPTVMKMALHPEMAPSTDGGNIEICNKVIVTAENIRNYSIETLLASNENDMPHVNNIFKKPINLDKNDVQKNPNLPNEAAIKALMGSDRQQKRSCAEESRNSHQTNLPDLWSRLILVLEVAVKRIEETLAEKIINEIKIISASLTNTNNAVLQQTAFLKCNKALGIEFVEAGTLSDKEVFVDNQRSKSGETKSLQCELVDNQIIDRLYLQLSGENPKYIIPTSSGEPLQKLKDPELMRDYFKALKMQPKLVVDDAANVEENLTCSAIAADVSHANERLSKHLGLRKLYLVPLSFLRENILVVSGVPSFIFMLLIIYYFIEMLVRAW